VVIVCVGRKKMSELIKCVMCGRESRFTAIAIYKGGLKKEALCINCKMIDEEIRRNRVVSQTTS